MARTPSTAWATAPTLPSSTSLAAELAYSLRAKQALVVMVSLEGCPFCKTVRANYLAPMHARGELRAVQVDMGSSAMTRDFAGTSVTHAELIRRWGVKVAPTVLFFGPQGTEIADRMVGAYVADFYGAYLDERLAQAQQKLKPGV
jgi:thioredoxin-related protein